MDGDLYCTDGTRLADMIKLKLSEEGFMVQARAISASKQQFEILVPSGEVEEIQEVLNSILRP